MASENLLSSRLLSLVENGQWTPDEVVNFFLALVKQFIGGTDESDFITWVVKMLYQVEINRIRANDLMVSDENSLFVDPIDSKICNIVKSTREKTMKEIMEEIGEQADFDKQVISQVEDIVSSVSTASNPTHLQGLKETLFNLCNAVEETMNYKPRQTQMVSWCILVLSNSNQLVQVGTGEGKSCIVAMFAAYQAMNNKNPDIISSSPVLAQRDAETWRPFYEKLNITVDVNTNKSKVSDLKNCYECQVVYGTTESFAGDWLRQCFHRKNVRPGRKFQCVIVDEVDSLMLDKGLEMVYLSSEMPVMEALNAILAEIWFVVKQLKYIDSKQTLGHLQPFFELLFYSLDGDIHIGTILQMAEDSGITPVGSTRLMKENKEDFLQHLHGVSVDQLVIFFRTFEKDFPQCSYKLFSENDDGSLQELNANATSAHKRQMSVVLLKRGMCRSLYTDEENLIKSLIKKFKKGSATSEMKQNGSIPGLLNFINDKLHTWIENAIQATKMTQGHEYIIHGDGVVPVDYKCTGVVQNNMKWGEGLQQFLELKHQTKLSNMSVITNLMSNVGLFKKYNNIYGITGTLGDETELHMLKKLYNGIRTCKIPSFKRRKLYELEGLMLSEEKEWIRTVCNVVKNQVTSTIYRGSRAALVICETINHAKMFYRAFENTILREKLKLYINNNMDNTNVVDKTVQEGDVIIATNLAGRGTDLKVCEEVNEAGGLFVVQTFLPLNVRVEQQAFGRTARQGSPGSAQLVMCSTHFTDSVKLVMALNAPLIHLLNIMNHLTTTLTCVFSQSLFEMAVTLYLETPSSHNYEAMESSLRNLLFLKSFPAGEGGLEMAKETRNMLVNLRLSGFLEKYIPEIMKKEEIFSEYLSIVDTIYEDVVFADQREEIVSSLHECWGVWLLMHFSKDKSTESLKQQLKVDMSRAKQTFLEKQSPSTMIYYYIRSGNKLRHKGSLAQSIEMYTKAVEEGTYREFIPLYNRALATIIKKDIGYIAEALADLENADKALESSKSQLERILTCATSASQEQKAKGDTLLTRQYQVKSVILDLLKINIKDAVITLKRAESYGGDIRISENNVHLLMENSLQIASAHFRSFLISPHLTIKELVMELVNIESMGLDTVFALEVKLSFIGLFTKLLGTFNRP